MTTSSQSGQSDRLFLSSSPTRCSLSPFEEVQVLLQQARSVNRVDPDIESIVASNYDAFSSMLSRHVALVQSRSQAFEDCQITIFDKVLLELTQYGSDLNSPSAVQYFCDQFLAIPIVASKDQKTSVLADTLFISNAIIPEVNLSTAQLESLSNGDTHPRRPEKKPLFGRKLYDVDKETLNALAANIDPVMSRLWSVYDQAKEEFHAVTNSDSKVKQTTAKFLRDTAENTLQYLQNKDVDQRLLQEIETTLEGAKHAAVTLHGGKKRKFDQQDSSDSVDQGNSKIDRSGSVSTTRKDTKSNQAHRPRESTSRRSFAGHARALAQYRTLRSTREEFQDRQAPIARELFPTKVDTRSHSRSDVPRSQPGRGHSNIPFGYSRPVDSYQPGK